MPRILIVTGEASGDMHGANLAAAIRALRPDATLLGVGGARMRAAGVELIQGIERLDVIGLLGFAQVRAVARTYLALRRFLRAERLDAVVLIDNPGLNLKVARVAARAGQRVVYYIAPQVWAWHPGRIRQLAATVRRMIVILPFEEALYRRAGIPCDFVGHPLLDMVAPSYDRVELRKRLGLAGEAPVIGLLPGSREKEVRALLPGMLEAVQRLQRVYPDLQAVVAQASSLEGGLIASLASSVGVTPRVVRDQPNEVMAVSDVLLVASGTATLQAAVIGTPMVIVYRVTWLSYWIARALITVDCIGLVNIVAGRKIVPELIQQEATGRRMYEQALRLLSDQSAAEEMRTAFRAVRLSLGEPGASRRAAAAVLGECRA